MGFVRRIILALLTLALATGFSLLFRLVPGGETMLSNFFWNFLGDIDIFGLASNILQTALGYQMAPQGQIGYLVLTMMIEALLDGLVMGCCIFALRSVFAKVNRQFEVGYPGGAWIPTGLGCLVGSLFMELAGHMNAAADALMSGLLCIGLMIFGIMMMLNKRPVRNYYAKKRKNNVAKMLIDIKNTGVELAVVIGGGNVWRGRRGAAMRMGTVAADQMGMLGTLQNCLYMRDTLAHMGAKATVMTAVDMPRFAEPYNTVKALDLLEQGHIVLFACGIGSPCFSTDTTVVLRGIELECDAILMAKNIDGVYTADPRIDPTATMIRDITYAEASAKGLKVMDAAAFTILSDNNVPQVRVFGLEPAENIIKVLEGDMMGTVLHP